MLSILIKAREKMLNLREKIVSEGVDDDWDDEDNENVEGDGEEAPRLVERAVSKQVTKQCDIDVDSRCCFYFTVARENLFGGFLFAMLGIP